MFRLKRTAATLTLTLLCAAVAAANQTNQRTTFKFDAPVMVPGATLQPGTYVFRLLDSDSDRHTVQVLSKDESKVMATIHAIPTERMEPRGDVVIRLNPTERGAPAAIKAWFYPGRTIGHEFVYSDEEAPAIAQRTKTLVLSRDVAGSDMEQGTLYVYDAQGRKSPWRGGDTAQATAQMKAPATGTPEATAPAMRSNPQGMQVSLDDLEDNPTRYTGKTVSVTGEIDEVLGPRVFKLDEPNWADLEGELLVYMPSNLAALVREGDRVTVTGTVRALARAEIERDLDWLEPEEGWDVDIMKAPALIAERIVGGNNNVALSIDLNAVGAGTMGAVGTSGTTARKPEATSAPEPLTDVQTVAGGERTFVGRVVDLDNVRVSRVDEAHGFWVQAGGAAVFVLPAQHVKGRPSVSAGQAVSIDGVVLEMPRAVRERKNHPAGANEAIYIYATGVK